MSRNPFAALAGDDDASEIGESPAPKQSKPTTGAANASSAPKSGSKPQQNAPRRHIVGQSAKPQEAPAADAPASASVGFEGERGRDDRGTGFGRGRGAARGRGEGRGRGAPRGGARGARGGREERPDRRSATGREDSAKAEHQGWGGDEGKRELEAETAGLGDAAEEVKEGGEAKETNGDDKAAAAPAAESAAAAAPVEEEDNTQTYEEYLKSRQTASIAGVNQVQARKANDGADESQWKDGVLVNKPTDNTETFFAITQEQKEKARKQKEKKEKQFLEVDFLPPAQKSSGERGGRGGARGGRGSERGSRGRGEGGRGRGAPRGAPRGAARGASSAGANINVDDNKAFPTLA